MEENVYSKYINVGRMKGKALFEFMPKEKYIT